MATLGTPIYLTVRVIGNDINKDISRALRGSQGNVTRDAQQLGRAFTRGFNRGVDVNAFSRVSNGLRSMVPEAEAARKGFASLVRTSYTLGSALTMVVGGASSAVSALGALGGAALGAASGAAVLGNGIFALASGMVAVRLATSGVGQALQRLQQQQTRAAAGATRTALQTVRDNQAREAATRRIEDAERSLARTIEDNRERMADANQAVLEAQNDLNAALRDGREEIQQIGFAAEDAALSEQRAALELERAREALMRTQDLPPNDRRRQEAELAYAEAELNYRKAKDQNEDLAKEQARLARTGVNGLNSVIDARNRLADAEQDRAETAADAARDEADAVRNLNEAREDAVDVAERQEAAEGGAAGAPGGAAIAAWDEGLNKYQRAFALFLNSLRPKFEELELIASAAFLPKLQTAIETLMEKAFPVVAVGIGLVAGAMGNAAIELANVITESQNLEKLATLFDSSARLIEIFGQSLGSVYDILMSILTVTAPLAEEFFGWLNDQLGQFADHLNSPEGKQELIDFFDRAAYTARLFGDVLGDVFGGIGAIIDANIGQGTGAEFLLASLHDVTEGFRDADLKQFFMDVAINAKQVFGSIGDLMGILARLGADQSVGEAFAALREGAPYLENILQTFIDAAPKFAEVVVTITKIVSALADTGALDVFFGTLNAILSWFEGFVSDPNVKAFLDFFGRIFAAFSAIGVIVTPILLGFKIFTGIILAIVQPIGMLVSAFSFLGPILATVGRVILPLITGALRVFNAVLLANPIGLIITAIGLLVGSLVWFFTQTEIGKKAWEEFTRFIGEAWVNVVKVFEDTIKIISDIFTGFLDWIYDLFGIASPSKVFMDIGQFIIDGFFQGIEAIGKVIGEVFENMLNFIIDLFMNWTIYGIIIQHWDEIVKFFQDVWTNITSAFDAAFKWIDQYVIQPFNRAWTEVGNFFRDVGLGMQIVWENFQRGLEVVWRWIESNIFGAFRTAFQELGNFFRDVGLGMELAWKALQTALDTVWKWIDSNIFNPIKTAVGLVQTAFENVADGIALAWEGIKKAAADPINFVIDTVYNNGLRSFWNDIAGALNMNNLKLPRVNKIAFAQGGVMPGYSPGRDIHRFYSPTGGYLHLSGGEAIMRPEWTRMMGGPKAIERMNAAARRGQAFASGGVYGSSIGRTQRFASGGVVDFAGDILEGLANVGKIIGDFFADPKSAVRTHIIDGIIKPMTSGMGDGMFADLIGEVPVTIAGWVGDAVKNLFGAGGGPKGTTGMGWQAMSQLVKQTIPGARITSAYRPGSITVNGSPSYHGSGRAIDVVPATMDTFNKMLALFPNARELIFSPAGNRQLLNGRPHMWGGKVRDTHWDHVHAAMAKGGTVYPSSGGTIVQVAEAGRAERIEPLDPNGISDRDRAWVELFTQGLPRGDVQITVVMRENEDMEAFAQRVSQLISRDMRMGALT